MQPHGLIHKFICSSFERWIQSELLVSKLTEEVHKHPHLTKCVIDITNSSKTINNLVKHGSTAELNAHVDLSSTACEDYPTLRHEHVRRRLEKSTGRKDDSPTQALKSEQILTFDFPNAVGR